MPTEHYGPSVTNGRGQRGTLETLPDGRVRARYREDGRTGRRPQRTFATRQEAANWLRDELDEVEQIRAGNTALITQRREACRTVERTVEDYLAAHDADHATLEKLARQLALFQKAFGPRLLATLETYELQAWRKTISPGYRHDVFGAARQVLKQAHAWNWIGSNPSDGIPNPRAPRREVTPLLWDHALVLADEIAYGYEAVPIVGCGTGLRPEEWIALERRDIDLEQGVIHVRRVYSQGRLRDLGPDGAKTRRQRRRVPLRAVVRDALADVLPRIDTPLWFPGRRRGKNGTLHLNLVSFRRDVWAPAFQAAGLTYQRPYDMRHTYASESIAAGVNLFDLSRFMGTSLTEIDDTYGHLVADSEERGRALLDAYDIGLNRGVVFG